MRGRYDAPTILVATVAYTFTISVAAICSNSRQRRRVHIVEQLEDRTLLTVVTTFESGQLVVSADADDSITIAVNGAGDLVVNNNNDPTGAGPFPASGVTSINVQGGPDDNNIDLAAVTQDDFTGLNGVTISGGDGQDNIIGSEFADVINGVHHGSWGCRFGFCFMQ